MRPNCRKAGLISRSGLSPPGSNSLVARRLAPVKQSEPPQNDCGTLGIFPLFTVILTLAPLKPSETAV